jgi:hypothetical protein
MESLNGNLDVTSPNSIYMGPNHLPTQYYKHQMSSPASSTNTSLNSSSSETISSSNVSANASYYPNGPYAIPGPFPIKQNHQTSPSFPMNHQYAHSNGRNHPNEANLSPLNSSTSSLTPPLSNSSVSSDYDLNYSRLNVVAAASIAKTNPTSYHHHPYLCSPVSTISQYHQQNQLSNAYPYLNTNGQQHTQNIYLNQLIAASQQSLGVVQDDQNVKRDGFFNPGTRFMPNSPPSSTNNALSGPVSHSSNTDQQKKASTTSNNVVEMQHMQQSRNLYKFYSNVAPAPVDRSSEGPKESKPIITPSMMSLEGKFYRFVN